MPKVKDLWGGGNMLKITKNINEKSKKLIS